MHVKLDYLCSDKDRHGNVRYYVRLPGQKKVRIREAPNTKAFYEAYTTAVGSARRTVAMAIRPGSFRDLCVKYFSTAQFKSLDVSTKTWQRRELESICEKHGDKPVKLMESRHVRKIRNEKQEYPAAANQRLKAMRAMFRWAMEEEEVESDPTAGVRNIKYAKRGHHSWTAEEIDQYRERHAVGTMARLALELLRYTACRREDAPRLGPSNVYIEKGRKRIRFIQSKNEDRSPVEVDMPLHPELERVINATKTGNETFLVTWWGKPFTTAGFGNRMKDWCRQADLPHCSAHGVRKSTPTQLADNHATPHEIMSITGHRTLKEVERYTSSADRKKNATRAMRKLK